MIPKGFRRFAELSSLLCEIDQSFEITIMSMYISVDKDIRQSIITYIQYILAPPVDLDALNQIWEDACGASGVYMIEREGVYKFLAAALPICLKMQSDIDAPSVK